MLRWSHLEISGGFLLLTAALYYLDSSGVVPWALAACTLHELGHVAAIRLLGGRVSMLRLTCVGAELRLSARYPLGAGRQLLAALAGPAVNLLLAPAAAGAAARWGEGAFLFAGLNLALGAFNLLPVAQLGAGEWAETALRVVSLVLAGGLAAGGCLLFLRGAVNVTLPLTAIWLLTASPVEKARLALEE